MTRDDAIFYIKQLQKTYASMDKKVAEAVDMAISALSAESDTLTHEEAWEQIENDIISRDALMEQLDERYCKPCQSRKEDYNGVRCRSCWVDDAVGEIEDAPSADRPITSGYIADDKEVPPYTTTSAVSADRPTCIDCTHWFEDGSYHAGWGLCNVHDSEWDKTGYCSYAERK